MAVKLRLRRIVRKAYRTSAMKVSIRHLDEIRRGLFPLGHKIGWDLFEPGMGTLFRFRRVRNVAGVLLVAALLVAALLHTPIVRARALTFLIAQLAEAGFVAHADALDYNALTLNIRLSGLTLAVPSATTAPFLAAKEVRLSLPWEVLGGRFGINHVEIVSPRVTLHRDANGRDNWTPESRDSASEPFDLHIGRALVSDLVVDWTDEQSASHVDAALSLDLTTTGTATAGPIALARPAQVRWRDRTTSISVLGGRVSWNDRDLAIEKLSLSAPEGAVTLDARIDELLGAGSHRRASGRRGESSRGVAVAQPSARRRGHGPRQRARRRLGRRGHEPARAGRRWRGHGTAAHVVRRQWLGTAEMVATQSPGNPSTRPRGLVWRAPRFADGRRSRRALDCASARRSRAESEQPVYRRARSRPHPRVAARRHARARVAPIEMEADRRER